MPLTPFHLGPGLLVGEFFEKRINLTSILLASVLVDLRAFYCFFWGCTGRFHGPLHTFVGATILALLISIVVWKLRVFFKKITDFFKVRNSYSFSSILIGSLIGTWLHILLDSFMHSDIIPFWPRQSNILLGAISDGTTYYFCTITLIVGLVVYVWRVIRR
ncbi:hypothetical protein K8R20_00120 [bacterium]|nr:hypothetical protein [bacterium]